MPLPKGEAKPPGTTAVLLTTVDPGTLLAFKDQCIRHHLTMVGVIRVLFRVYTEDPGDFVVPYARVIPPTTPDTTLHIRWLSKALRNRFKAACGNRGLFMTDVIVALMEKFVKDPTFVLDRAEPADYRPASYVR